MKRLAHALLWSSPDYIEEETGAQADITVRSILKNIDSKKRDTISADGLEPFFRLAAYTICITCDGFSEKKLLSGVKPGSTITIDELFSVSTK